MKELKPLIRPSTPLNSSSGTLGGLIRQESEVVPTKTVPKPELPSLPKSLMESEKKTVMLPLPGSELNTASQSPSNEVVGNWPFPSSKKGVVVPQIASMVPPLVTLSSQSPIVPELRPLPKKEGEPPKLVAMTKPSTPGVVQVAGVPSLTPIRKGVEKLENEGGVVEVPDTQTSQVSIVPPPLEVIRAPSVVVVNEIPALTPVIKNDELYVIVGINATGEIEYKGVYTKSKLMDMKGADLREKAYTLLHLFYTTQGGNADWVRRRNTGNCSDSPGGPPNSNDKVIHYLRVVDNARDLSVATWQNSENEADEAHPYVTYKLVMFKTNMNELDCSVPLSLL